MISTDATVKVTWMGRPVSDNDRLVPTSKRMVPNHRYLEFKRSLAWSLRAEAVKRAWGEAKTHVDLWIEVVGVPLLDAQNVVKAVCDAIEMANLITNDRGITIRLCRKVGLVKKADDSKIEITVREAA